MSDTPEFFAHPTATVDLPANIGEGTRIWHYSHIMSGARIGPRCSLGQNVFVAATAKLGTNVKVQNNVSIYDGVCCEDDVFLGPSCVFTNVQTPRSHVVRRDAYQSTFVGKGASIGANATIVCGVTIGAYAFIGAGAVVTKDVPPHALMVGVPARRAGWACWCGVTLPDPQSGGICSECGRRYRYTQADEQLLEDTEGGHDA